jgi:hypothetical protein
MTQTGNKSMGPEKLMPTIQRQVPLRRSKSSGMINLLKGE